MHNRIISRFIFVFVSLLMITIPFPHQYFPDIAGLLHPFFESIVKWSGSRVFQINHPYTSKLISDSTGLYIHVFNCSFIAALAAVCWTLARKNKKDPLRLYHWFRIVVSYYLALQLFEYGFSKLFKWQFYIPEPNTLFTTMGNTYRDLMYWSTMGLSRPYTVIAGCIEILAGVLLLFKGSRLAGAMLAIIVLTNVVAINFCYDISVKALSCFLLLQSILLITPFLGNLLNLFFNKQGQPESTDETSFALPGPKIVYQIFKVFIIIFMFFSTLSVYFTENNFNDDQAPRPPLHGAWDVVLFVKNNDTLLPLLTDTNMWRRVFVHRKDYFITQDMGDNMVDYSLLTDTVNHNLFIERAFDKKQFALAYTLNPDHSLSLSGIMDQDSLNMQLKPIDLKKLPALQHEFNWTIDQ